MIKVGATAWSDRSLLASGWYPREARTPEARLRYYATQFAVTENDSTYYAIPEPRRSELWVARTPAVFTTDVKAFATLTDHYTDPDSLPADIRNALRPDLREKARVYPRDLGTELVGEIARRFCAGIEPLRANGRLGVVLFQYPVWFTNSRENRDQVRRARELVPGCRLAVEFRNRTWMSEQSCDRTLGLLREVGLAYVSVDEPQGFPSSVPPIAEATADVAVVRFHGRNASRWARSAAAARERFDYRYSTGELCEWLRKLRRLDKAAKEVHALMNNCHADYAVTNARQLIELLAERRAVVQRPDAAAAR
jgi:uncharacterized protein YecE (DUF72 family)